MSRNIYFLWMNDKFMKKKKDHESIGTPDINEVRLYFERKTFFCTSEQCVSCTFSDLVLRDNPCVRCYALLCSNFVYIPQKHLVTIWSIVFSLSLSLSIGSVVERILMNSDCNGYTRYAKSLLRSRILCPNYGKAGQKINIEK